MHDQVTGPRFLYQYWGLYQGHYIGLVEGQVIAMAQSPMAAFARARQSRPRRMPTVIKVWISGMVQNQLFYNEPCLNF